MQSLEKVFGKGCLLDLNVRQWTAEKQLQPEDLGLRKQEVPESYRLGRKKLIPTEAIRQMHHWEYLARKVVSDHSFPFPFGEARFVSRTELDDCIKELDDVISNFDASADELVRKYSEHKIAMRAEFTKAAQDAYRRRATLCGGLSQPEDEYVNEFLERVDRAYPNEGQLRSKYSMTYVVFQVSLPDITRATYEDIARDGERIRVLREAFQMSVEQRVRQFVEDTVGSLRQQARKDLDRAASTLRNGRPSSATFKIIRKMIERYERMDMFGDDEFKRHLREFKTRVLNRYDAEQVREDDELRSKILQDVEALSSVAINSASISQLVERCKDQVSV